MTIIDNRDKENDLIKFKELPAWCVFEVPDCDGFYIKLDKERQNSVTESGDGYINVKNSIVNTIRLDYPMAGFKYTLSHTAVRPLDVELHINGVKKF